MERSHLPTPTEETLPYWDGLREGRLRLPVCDDCGRVHFYPRPLCPHCWADAIGWTDASGEGTVYAQTTVHRAPSPAFEEDVPYIVAIVALAEGPHMMSRLVDANPDVSHVGTPVTMVQATEGGLPLFRPRPT